MLLTARRSPPPINGEVSILTCMPSKVTCYEAVLWAQSDGGSDYSCYWPDKREDKQMAMTLAYILKLPSFYG